MVKNTHNLPPTLSGALPGVGHLVQFQRDHNELFRRGHARHGDVFTIRLLNRPAVVVSGPAHNRTVYQNTDTSLNMYEGYSSLRAAIGEVLFIAGNEIYENQRPLLQSLFKRDKMTRYIGAMNKEIDAWLGSLGASGEVEITAAMNRLTQYVAGRAFIGENFHYELGETFWTYYEDIGRSIDPFLPQQLPLPKFKRRDRAKAYISRTFNRLIEARRRDPDAYDDMISHILNTPMADGEIMDDETISIFFTGILFAGHETTAGQAAWTIIELLKHPEYLKIIEQELAEHTTPGEALEPGTLRKLKHTYHAIDEVTRLHPSADIQIRTTDEPVEFGDYTVPAGWTVIVNAAVSHHMEGVFEDPARFDPLRFAKPRKEGKDPNSIVGFGGGRHKCTGINFAKNEMAIIVAKFFASYDAELITTDTRTVSDMGANRPSETRVRYTLKTAR